MKRTVLVYFLRRHQQTEVLLIQKKRGQGKGYWNAPGGKCHAGESFESAAVRESLEEVGLRALELQHRGRLEFRFADASDSVAPMAPAGAIDRADNWDNVCEVYVCERFEGDATESDEALPQWFDSQALPWDAMWKDDVLWLPLVLGGQNVWREYVLSQSHELLSEVIRDGEL